MVKKIKEMDELKKAFTDAGDKPVMVEFYASWCPPCSEIAPKVVAFSKKYTKIKVYKVDTDKSEDITRKYRINAMPTFKVFIRGRAARGGSSVGPNAEQLEELFKKFNKD